MSLRHPEEDSISVTLSFSVYDVYPFVAEFVEVNLKDMNYQVLVSYHRYIGSYWISGVSLVTWTLPA